MIASPVKVLFVCSRNQWRSPTAEAVFRKRQGIDARSAGTSKKARHTVSAADLRWADVILVMEKKHRNWLTERFGETLQHNALHILHIPDDYRFMDPELIEVLEEVVPGVLNGPTH